MNNEPQLEDIDDYNNNESPEKRKIIKLVIIVCLILGALFATIKYKYNVVDDYVGTPASPGINTTKNL